MGNVIEPVGAGLVPAQGDHKGRPYNAMVQSFRLSL
jgi:hypothetical protein